jgi:hypothetical protein
MKKYFVLVLLFSGIILSAQEKRVKPDYSNPIIPDMIADPSIVEIDGIFYCHATTDGYDKGLATSGPPTLWISKDFVNWSFTGSHIPSAVGQRYWAPSSVTKVNNKYYLYPTIRDIYAWYLNHLPGHSGLLTDQIVSLVPALQNRLFYREVQRVQKVLMQRSLLMTTDRHTCTGHNGVRQNLNLIWSLSIQILL